MLSMDAMIAGVVLPTIAEQLQIENSQAVMVVTAYQLILAMTLMPFAALGTRIGLRRVYCGGLILHSLAAMLCFIADNLPLLILARSLQAVGTAAGMSVGFGLIRMIYPSDQLGKGMSLNTIANASGTALAPVTGGMIASMLGWQWVFSAAIPFSIFALLLSRALPEPQPHVEPFDVRGAALCAVTFGFIIGGLELLIHGPSKPLALLILALGLLLGWLFVRHELRVPGPVLPVDLLARPAVAMAIVSNFSAVLGSITLLLFMPFMLQNSYGYSPGEVGGMLAFYAFASVMVAPTSGYLSDRIPVVILCTAGMCVSACGLLLVATMPEQVERFDIAWRLWICGAGFGMFFSPNARLIIGLAPHKYAASAGSMVTTSRMLGLATGATIVAGLLGLGLGDTSVPLFCSLGLVLVSGGICVARWIESKAAA